MYSNGKENVSVIGPLIKNFGIFFLSGAICQFVYIGKYVTKLFLFFLHSELISVFFVKNLFKISKLQSHGTFKYCWKAGGSGHSGTYHENE